MTKGKVKVWNDNSVIWTESFKGEKITIPAKSFVEMDFYEAHEFKGQFSPVKLKGDGTQDPTTFKMIRVEMPTKETADGDDDGQEIFQCNMCRKIFTTDAALTKHSESQHADHIVVDADAEKLVAKKRGRPTKAKTDAAETEA